MKTENHYGYVYITTNRINGMKYIGQHGGDFDPRYKGSGRDLMKAMVEFGRENFTVDLICYAESFDELNDLEYKYITMYDAVKSDNFYNKTDEKLHLDFRDVGIKKYLSSGISHKKGEDFGDKMRELRRKTIDRKGKSYWITNEIDEHLVTQIEHTTMYPSYRKGRISDTIYMFKGDITVKIPVSKKSIYVEDGYIEGKSKSINDNIINSRRKEIWSYEDNDFSCAAELTEFLRCNKYPRISKGTVVNLSKGIIVKSYLDLVGKIKRRPKDMSEV